MENGEWKMNDTVYGVSPGLVLHEMYTVGCADLGAPSLTIVTCVTVGANIVRPQHDRSLCKERPHIRLTITCTDGIATVNHGRKTVQIRPQKTFSKKFEKRVDETGILLYTKQVVSDESSKTTTT